MTEIKGEAKSGQIPREINGTKKAFDVLVCRINDLETKLLMVLKEKPADKEPTVAEEPLRLVEMAYNIFCIKRAIEDQTDRLEDIISRLEL